MPTLVSIPRVDIDLGLAGVKKSGGSSCERLRRREIEWPINCRAQGWVYYHEGTLHLSLDEQRHTPGREHVAIEVDDPESAFEAFLQTWTEMTVAAVDPGLQHACLRDRDSHLIELTCCPGRRRPTS